MRAIAIRTTAVLAVFFGLLVSAQDSRYQLRFNRYEGFVGLPYAGERELRVLSFVAAREPVQLAKDPELKIRFYLPQPRPVYITAVQLRRSGQSHYRMRPQKTAWDAGWQEFAPWPTADVLAPNKISPDDLGVVARLDRDLDSGSGSFAPVIVYAGRKPPQPAPYVVQFLYSATLARVDYSLANMDSRRYVTRGRLCQEMPGQSTPCVAGNMPFAIQLDLSNQPSGNYRLIVSTRELGKTSGPSHEFLFWHQAN